MKTPPLVKKQRPTPAQAQLIAYMKAHDVTAVKVIEDGSPVYRLSTGQLIRQDMAARFLKRVDLLQPISFDLNGDAYQWAAL